MIGISLQVSMKKEIVNSNTAAIVKEVCIDREKFIVRKTNVSINNENICVLQSLELLQNPDKYIRKFPDAACRFYYEMRLDNVLR